MIWMEFQQNDAPWADAIVLHILRSDSRPSGTLTLSGKLLASRQRDNPLMAHIGLQQATADILPANRTIA